MHRGELIEQVGIHHLQPGLEQLRPDPHGEESADEEHDEREPQVQGPDVLVIGGEHPAEQARIGPMVIVVVGVRRVRAAHDPQPPVFKFRAAEIIAG